MKPVYVAVTLLTIALCALCFYLGRTTHRCPECPKVDTVTVVTKPEPAPALPDTSPVKVTRKVKPVRKPVPPPDTATPMRDTTVTAHADSLDSLSRGFRFPSGDSVHVTAKARLMLGPVDMTATEYPASDSVKTKIVTETKEVTKKGPVIMGGVVGAVIGALVIIAAMAAGI